MKHSLTTTPVGCIMHCCGFNGSTSSVAASSFSSSRALLNCSNQTEQLLEGFSFRLHLNFLMQGKCYLHSTRALSYVECVLPWPWSFLFNCGWILHRCQNYGWREYPLSPSSQLSPNPPSLAIWQIVEFAHTNESCVPPGRWTYLGNHTPFEY